MKFFSLKELSHTWSMWAASLTAGVGVGDYSLGLLDGIIPEDKKPLVYVGLSLLVALVRSIKQPKLSK